MADQAYGSGQEIHEQTLGSGQGGAKLENAAGFAREPRHAGAALDGPGVA